MGFNNLSRNLQERIDRCFMFAMTSLCTQGNKLTQDAFAYNCARLLDFWRFL